MNIDLIRQYLAYLQREEGDFNLGGGNGLVYVLVVILIILAILWLVGQRVTVG